MADNGPGPQVTEHFRLVFFSILALTIGSLLVSGAIAIFVRDPMTEQAKNIFNVTLSIFQIGAGAVIGLIGGKAIR